MSLMGRILRVDEVLEFLGISRSSLYRYIKTGHIPAPVQIGPGRVGWPEAVLTEWQATRVKEAGI